MNPSTYFDVDMSKIFFISQIACNRKKAELRPGPPRRTSLSKTAKANFLRQRVEFSLGEIFLISPKRNLTTGLMVFPHYNGSSILPIEPQLVVNDFMLSNKRIFIE